MTIDNEELSTLAHERLLRALEEIQAELNRREGETFLDIDTVGDNDCRKCDYIACPQIKPR